MLYHAVTFAITLALLQFIWLQPPFTSKTRLKNKDAAFTAREFEYGGIKILLLLRLLQVILGAVMSFSPGREGISMPESNTPLNQYQHISRSD